ncbi:MAG TPA: PQQ-binding-like beta-propeller repeat protein [Candidatus Polarisedimenticolia bacterium]|jgi:outer membrane protein assembly factor BamB|nr:PQQ-binding-like beta-propeller repeat protein [Candidatus Polarisedimenticolia bacterium]
MIRRFTTLILALALAATAAGAQATFHGDVARTGVFGSPGPKRFGGVKWTFKAGGPIVASPVVADGVVYVGSLDGHLYAIDQESGKEKWNFKSRMPIASTAAVAGDTLYFVSSVGSLAALETATGKPKWVFAAEFEKRFEAKNLHGLPSAAQTIPDAWDLFTSSPAVANGKVYFGSGDSNVYAVDAATGLLQWKFQTGDVVHASPAVADGTVYIGSWDSRLYALRAETGELRWSFQAGEDPSIHNQVGFQSSPAVVDGVVYVGCRDAHVYALDAGTGRKKWDYPTSKSWVIGTPAVRKGTVYVGTSDSSRFMALDAKTGRLRFNFDAKAYMFSSAAVAGDLAYVGDHNGRLYAIEADTGRLAWEFQTEGSRKDPMKALNPDGRLNQEAFKPLFGDFQDMYIDYYRFISIGAVVSSPAVSRGVVYFGSMDGTLYALQ